ncbi:carboxymuconolactone decarboxylase family protein [Paenibacillus sp. CAA11]|uniref:carboxymuconolactone decarboxylase family protein n=1 Tax=Paenibacillus sp. CAA11 TaxID=1532905 RepID=UPI000D388E15|nr:carboxymuconolactone decarboxylase family protein [Paenibacillus sp. CAA11]AWB44185.1 carboxymuconolactone decarboxylase family protein [Paenibacillus sp. CAA11]
MSLTTDKITAYKEEINRFGDSLPETAEAYHEFTGKALQNGVLDAKVKHLIALGVGLFANNEVCTFYHANEARAKGATDAEILEASAAASAAAAGHILSQGAIRVQQALDQI